MASNLQVESPAFDRIRKGDNTATEDGIRLLWFALNNLYRVESVDFQSASRTFKPAVKSDSPSVNQDNYDMGDATVLLLGQAGAFNLTGIRNGTSGRIVIIVNLGAGTMTAKQAVTSDIFNQLQMAAAADKAVATNKAIVFIYLNSRWRELSLA